VTTIRYCKNGHWEDTGEPAYLMPRRLEAVRRQQATEALRLARVKFCDRCGAELISTCPECEYPIEHASDGSGAPRYCRGCGKPYPWTATALRSAKEYADHIDVLSVEDRAELKESFDDLTMDTPRTPIAASRYKRILTSAGPVAKEIVTKTLIDVITNGAKELLGSFLR
jgi:hypothetical protein